MLEVTEMTDDELTSEWLACERAIGDPVDDDQPALAEARQLEIEREQDRRDSGE